MEALARQLALQLQSTANETLRLIVAIDGPGCCGKSTLGDRLVALTNAAVLGTDDFHLPRGAPQDPNSPLPYRRWTEFRAALELLASGKPARFRPIDWKSRGLLPEMTLQPERLILVEGIGSMHPSLASLVGYRIWVDGLAQTRLQRVACRDGADVAANWDEYIPFEQLYLENSRPWRQADLWVYGAELTPANAALSFSRLIEAHGSAVRCNAGLPPVDAPSSVGTSGGG